jgi:hypothetical protein
MGGIMRFRLRLMLLLVAIAAVCLAVFGQMYRSQRAATEMQRQAQKNAEHAKQINNFPAPHK